MYTLLRPLLFLLAPETASTLALRSLAFAPRRRPRPMPRVVMGLNFPNPIGLAAGLDKNADHIDRLGKLGVGFIEVGTVTPKAQPGNPPPRLFRLPEARAVINRMGFNNRGVDYLVERLNRARYPGIVGINIGKNLSTPLERAADDYLHCLTKVYAHAGYVSVNLSSPNTPGLRELQHGAALDHLLSTLKTAQAALAERHHRYVPLAVKIAPDLNAAQLAELADALRRHRVDAVIATNTSSGRAGVEHLPLAAEAGGLSGAPLTDMATAVVARLHRELAGALPIIAAGGVMTGADAGAKFAAGAALVQLYTGLVYAGPALIDAALAASAAPSEPTSHTSSAVRPAS